MDGSWRPLLDEEQAARALTIAKEIADAVARGEGAVPQGFSTRQIEIWQQVLGSGNAGFSLLHAYLYWCGGGASHADQAIEHLDKAADFIASVRTSESLYYGFPGVGWATSHLSGHLFEAERDDGVDLDEALCHFLSHPSRPGEYDLINGFVGLGIYALERIPIQSAVNCLEMVVAKLAERAIVTAEGAAFFTPADEMLPLYRASYPQGGFNLGVAHGLPGVIALLGAVCRVGIAAHDARALLDAAVSWLMARERPPESDFRFPHLYAPGVEPPPGRLAWCYGDLGIAVALFMAGRGAGNPLWEHEGLRIAHAAAQRDPSRSRIEDAGICHGAAGAAHLFNRLYQATGDEQLAEAARYWICRAFSLRRPGTGLAGFCYLGRNDGSGVRWSADPGFLAGASGTALALLAASSPVTPAWDRLLLASMPDESAEPRSGK